MKRVTNLLVALFALVTGAVTFALFQQGDVRAHPSSTPGLPQTTTCTYIPLEFSLTANVTQDNMRPFTPQSGESYEQFAPTAPLTTTGSSTGNLLLYDRFAGSVAGDISGTFSLNNLNGIAITGSTIGQEARGFLINNLIVTDTVGSMNLLFTANFHSAESSQPFYPRFLDGYVHSISTSGGYSQYRLGGTFTGVMSPPTGGTVPVFITVDGKLFTGFNDPSNGGIFSGSRTLPVTHTVTLQPSDILARFVVHDMPAGSSDGYFDPISTFTGQTSGGFTGTFTLDSHSMMVGSSFTFSSGWIAGNLRVTSSLTDTMYGPWLGDLPGVAFHGYFFQAGGTGIYANSLIFERADGAIAYNGGEDIAGGFGQGYYCSDMIPVSGTFTPTPSPVATSTPLFTSTAMPTSTSMATATSTRTPTATITIEPSSTSTQVPTSSPSPVATDTALPTDTPLVPSATPTSPVATATATETPTSTSPVPPATPTLEPTLGATGTATPTVCTVRFQDVPPDSTFYTPVMCLACAGIINGYPCGGTREPCDGDSDPYFRPNSSITRGQAAKIVSEAAGFNDAVSGQTFEDVPSGSTFYEYVERLFREGNNVGLPMRRSR